MRRLAAILLLTLACACGGADPANSKDGTSIRRAGQTAQTPRIQGDGAFPRFGAFGQAERRNPAAPREGFRPDTIEAGLLDGMDVVPTNFIRFREIVKAQPLAPQAPGDPIGAFRFICQSSQVNYDDPIVYPGIVNGSPHLHQWFGNTAANAYSTYRSLRTTGESTCMGPLNRSAYWMPAMFRGDGMIVRPDYLVVYYKRYPAASPLCRSTARGCIGLPRGLRYIFGFDMKRMGEPQPENLRFHWKCVTPQNTQRGGLEARFDVLDCPAGNLLMVTLAAPHCWDGRNLDSPDHRSHMAYQVYEPTGGPPVCPSTHPYLIPEFTLAAAYSIAPGERISNWYLSSDRMKGMPRMAPGSTYHTDWYGAWDDKTAETWTANCIDRNLNCSDGQLGDGTAMRRPAFYALTSVPRLINPSATR